MVSPILAGVQTLEYSHHEYEFRHNYAEIGQIPSFRPGRHGKGVSHYFACWVAKK